MGVRVTVSAVLAFVLGVSAVLVQAETPFTTDDRQAILDFNLVGTWAVIDDHRPGDPTAFYFAIHPDGTTRIIQTNCARSSGPAWEYEDGIIALTEDDGTVEEFTVIAVPTEWGGTLLTGAEKPWRYFGDDPNMEC